MSEPEYIPSLFVTARPYAFPRESIQEITNEEKFMHYKSTLHFHTGPWERALMTLPEEQLSLQHE